MWEVGRPVHTGQLVDACTVLKVNVLCACMSHWVGNDFQQQQQLQPPNEAWQACPSCAFECVKLAATAQNTHTPCCATSMTHTTRRGTYKTTLSIFIHIHTHTVAAALLPHVCLYIRCIFSRIHQKQQQQQQRLPVTSPCGHLLSLSPPLSLSLVMLAIN